MLGGLITLPVFALLAAQRQKTPINEYVRVLSSINLKRCNDVKTGTFLEGPIPQEKLT
jgi:hypothetical protein